MNDEPDKLAPYEVEQYPEIYDTGESTPAQPDIVDVPLDTMVETPDTSRDIDVDRMDELELLDAVMRRGCVRFNDGRMLTKCPCRNRPAICGLYSMPDTWGYDRMVCSGPVVAEDTKGGILTQKHTYYTVKPAKKSCPYHPSKLDEKPDRSSGSNSGWLNGF